ncbi:PH domain-containing protein [Catellatospora sp. NPDC049133]|jgi:hypothetical protein|uniref:PH domain-containing protein n=1 Tax=Catellatospora sp. NPDC049133 TaxID=3155499 RepID=UPI0033F38433
MRKSWRSPFWNIVLCLVMSVMALTSTASTIGCFEHPGGWWAGIGFAVMTGLLLVGAVRALFVGVSAGPQGITVRGVTKTTRIAWSEISQITLGGLNSAAAGGAGASAPVVTRMRQGQPDQRVELKELGSYGMSSGPSLAERAVADLNECLAAWHESNRAAEDPDAARRRT